MEGRQTRLKIAKSNMVQVEISKSDMLVNKHDW